MKSLFAVLVAAATLLWAGCDRPEGPSVVLVTIDTLRADHLSAYGYQRSTSPRIDELAARGVLFENSYSQTNSTNPSHTTILTGSYVKTHGVIANTVGFSREDLPTLAELFQDAGYATAGIVSAGHLNRNHAGLGRGFDHFENVRPRPNTPEGASPDWTRPAREAVDQAIAWINEQARPFFLWLHLFDPHLPYQPEIAFERRLGMGRPGRIENIAGIYDRSIELDRLFIEQPDLSAAEHELYEAIYRRVIPIEAMIYNGVGWTREETSAFRALYDGEIAQTDAELGRLIDHLAAGQTTPLIALTADHGEAFGKGGVFFDHRGIYNASIRVPLIVQGAGVTAAGLRVPDAVQAIDIAPTLLELVGLERPATMPGRSLATAMAGRGTIEPTPIYVEHANAAAVAMIDGDWKLILSLLEGREDVDPLIYRHAKVELYNLRTDPGEAQDLSASEAERVENMRSTLVAWLMVDRAEVGEAELSAEMRSQLQSLGYIN